jgi:hypothetical protein
MVARIFVEYVGVGKEVECWSSQETIVRLHAPNTDQSCEVKKLLQSPGAVHRDRCTMTEAEL